MGKKRGEKGRHRSGDAAGQFAAQKMARKERTGGTPAVASRLHHQTIITPCWRLSCVRPIPITRLGWCTTTLIENPHNFLCVIFIV